MARSCLSAYENASDNAKFKRGDDGQGGAEQRQGQDDEARASGQGKGKQKKDQDRDRRQKSHQGDDRTSDEPDDTGQMKMKPSEESPERNRKKLKGDP